MREVPDGADGAKRLADAALAASCATLSPNTADPCLVARLAAESRERSRSLTDPRARRRAARQEGRGLERAGTSARRDAGRRSGSRRFPFGEQIAFTRRQPAPYHQGNTRIAGAFCAAAPPGSCAMEHIVLEYDESTRTALVVATSGGREPVLSGHASPYIVADGYDFESRSWGAEHYFTDIAEAKIDYERSCRHPYPLAEGKLRDDEFCTIRWCREDVAAAISEYLAYPIPATEKNIDTQSGIMFATSGPLDRGRLGYHQRHHRRRRARLRNLDRAGRRLLQGGLRSLNVHRCRDLAERRWKRRVRHGTPRRQR
ncbi:MAG: hypothetical protein ACLVJ1_04585 [Oscillospiraceae bacterium]